jgi:hypothetical protein
VSDAPDGFLARWSQRKAKLRKGEMPDAPPSTVKASAALGEAAPAAVAAAGTGQAAAAGARAESVPAPALPPPTLDDVAALDRDSDFRRFVAADATPEVRNAAMKKLFSDPHFNVMDGLDTYIDDYGKPDPIPASMLRQMVQSHALGLFADEEKPEPGEPPARATPDGTGDGGTAHLPSETSNTLDDDHNAALRLQPLDAVGPLGDSGGAGQDTGRER